MPSEALKLAIQYAGFSSIKNNIEISKEQVSALKDCVVNITADMDTDNKKALEAIQYLSGFLTEQLTVAQTNVAYIRLKLNDISTENS